MRFLAPYGRAMTRTKTMSNAPPVTHNRPVFTADVAASSTFASAHFGTATVSSYSTPSTDCFTVRLWVPEKYASRSAIFTPKPNSRPGNAPVAITWAQEIPVCHSRAERPLNSPR